MVVHPCTAQWTQYQRKLVKLVLYADLEHVHRPTQVKLPYMKGLTRYHHWQVIRKAQPQSIQAGAEKQAMKERERERESWWGREFINSRRRFLPDCDCATYTQKADDDWYIDTIENTTTRNDRPTDPPTDRLPVTGNCLGTPGNHRCFSSKINFGFSFI